MEVFPGSDVDHASDTDQSQGKDIHYNSTIKTLYLCPVVHNDSELGSLAATVTKQHVRQRGIHATHQKKQIIDDYWRNLRTNLLRLSLDFSLTKIYQDGLPVCGKESEIIQDLANQESYNHILLVEMMNKGARIMGTESADLLLQEYDLAKKTLNPERLLQQQKRQYHKKAEQLLKQRDMFIADRVNTTLQNNETGILFIGMLHNVTRFLDHVLEVHIITGVSEK